MPVLPVTQISGVVTHYPYRTAMVGDIVICGPSAHYSDLWQALADESFTRPDNHQVFAVTNEAGFVLYFMFSDDKTYIGTKIMVGDW